MASAHKEYFWDCHSRRLFCPLPPHHLVILVPALSHPPKHNFQTTMEKIPILLRGVYPFFPCHVLLFGTGDLGGSHPRHGSPLWLSNPPAGTFLSGVRTV